MKRAIAVFGLGIAIGSAGCGNEPATCPENLSIDISNFGLQTYNAFTWSGQGSGTFTCNGGGGGSASGARNGTSFDLAITYAGCVQTGSESTLTLTGALHIVSDLTSHVETGHADALQIKGSETACTASSIDATCVVDWSYTGRDSNMVPVGSGTVCGLTFP